MAILAELKDPRVRDVTVTHVEVSGDMRQAKVYVSVMGDEGAQQLSLRGLESAAGFLQSRLAQRIDTRYTPRLKFVLDQGVKKSIEVSRILREVLPPEEEPEEGLIPPQESDEIAQPSAEPGEPPSSRPEVRPDPPESDLGPEPDEPL